MDRWLLSRLHTLIREVDGHLEHYRITETTRALDSFVDELSNWYVRRSRERFWGTEMTEDKAAAYMTLYTALVTLAKLAAPVVPFISEQIYRNLVCSVDAAAPISVHLCDYPQADARWIDPELEQGMGGRAPGRDPRPRRTQRRERQKPGSRCALSMSSRIRRSANCSKRSCLTN